MRPDRICKLACTFVTNPDGMHIFSLIFPDGKWLTDSSSSAIGVSCASGSDQASRMTLPEACCKAAAAADATCTDNDECSVLKK